ncbi:MAG: hypothetical protein EOP45_11760 [Sphingobacteriaceae bacterium]|nr:MAG: hypothetical protein EOP45_11760 [Sphingobacteriaceae bacterium]
MFPNQQELFAKLRHQIPSDFLVHVYENRHMSITEFENTRQVLYNEFFHNFHLRSFIASYISDWICAPNGSDVPTTRINPQVAWNWIDIALYNSYYFTFHVLPPPRKDDPLCREDAANGDYYNNVRINFMRKVILLFENPVILQTPVNDILRTLRLYVAHLLHSTH